MKIYCLIALLVSYSLLFCTTRTVALDGSQQYTSIQAAVNDSRNGDVVKVFPGNYEENIELINYSISLVSLYATDPQQQYIDNTIIDGNLTTCIRVVNGETITINGFTIVNNEESTYNSPTNAGGGLFVANYSSATINNSIIRNCIAQSGGGIAVTSHSSLSLSKVLIFDNFALRYGGGLVFNESESLTFDPVNLCSIYNNVGTLGMDINISYRYPSEFNFSIFLDTGSAVLSESDDYFIQIQNAIASVNILHGYLDLIDHDLYVSPDGDDENDGFSPISPKKNIARAMQRIASNPDNPRTIYLAPGLYSHTQNGQLFPIGMKSHTRVIGFGTEESLLDGEMLRTFWNISCVTDIEISGMKMINGRSIYTWPMGVLYSSDIRLNNLVFDNNWGTSVSGLLIGYCEYTTVENIIDGHTTYDNNVITIDAFECNDLFVNNVISSNNTITDWESNSLGFRMSSCDLVLRNSIIANHYAQDAWPLFYTNIYPGFEDFKLDMSNVLIMNNTMFNCWWVEYPIYLQNRFQTMQINNCTFANNTTNRVLTKIIAGADIRNLISYNPDALSEITVTNHLEDTGLSYDVSISNSLFGSQGIYANDYDHLSLTDNIMSSNPAFLGTDDTSLNEDQPEYYQLSSLSPCIDSGTPDTTGMNLPPMDLAGNNRIWNGRIDMGCYEYGSDPYVSNDDPEIPIPQEGILVSVYPNPLLATSRGAGVFIEFTLLKKPAAQPVIDIYNIRGQKVKTIRVTESYNSLVHKAGLSGEVKQNGEFYSTVWNGKGDNNQSLRSGTYIIRVTAESISSVKRITLIK